LEHYEVVGGQLPIKCWGPAYQKYPSISTLT